MRDLVALLAVALALAIALSGCAAKPAPAGPTPWQVPSEDDAQQVTCFPSPGAFAAVLQHERTGAGWTRMLLASGVGTGVVLEGDWTSGPERRVLAQPEAAQAAALACDVLEAFPPGTFHVVAGRSAAVSWGTLRGWLEDFPTLDRDASTACEGGGDTWMRVRLEGFDHTVRALCAPNERFLVRLQVVEGELRTKVGFGVDPGCAAWEEPPVALLVRDTAWKGTRQVRVLAADGRAWWAMEQADRAPGVRAERAAAGAAVPFCGAPGVPHGLLLDVREAKADPQAILAQAEGFWTTQDRDGDQLCQSTDPAQVSLTLRDGERTHKVERLVCDPPPAGEAPFWDLVRSLEEAIPADGAIR